MISHWATVNISLLGRQLRFLYGPDHPKLHVDSCCSALNLPLSNEVCAQTSYRFLHILGNVAEISQKDIICYSPGLFRAGLKSKEVLSCLQLLPDIFHKAMTVVSRMVDGYLGLARAQHPQPQLGAQRPRVNTLLHLFGPWLFPAALLDTEYSGLASTSTHSDQSFSAGQMRVKILAVV